MSEGGGGGEEEREAWRLRRFSRARVTQTLGEVERHGGATCREVRDEEGREEEAVREAMLGGIVK